MEPHHHKHHKTESVTHLGCILKCKTEKSVVKDISALHRLPVSLMSPDFTQPEPVFTPHCVILNNNKEQPALTATKSHYEPRWKFYVIYANVTAGQGHYITQV